MEMKKMAIAVMLVLGLVLVRPAAPATADYNDLLIVRFVYNPAGTGTDDEEYVKIYNNGATTVNLDENNDNIKIGDEETEGGGEGMFRFPTGASIGSGNHLIIAKDATAFYDKWGFDADYEFDGTKGGVPDMIKYSSWGSGSFALHQNGDEVLILDQNNGIVDSVAYENGNYSAVGLASTGDYKPPNADDGAALSRNNITDDTDNMYDDFNKTDAPNAVILRSLAARSAAAPLFPWPLATLAGTAALGLAGLLWARRRQLV